MYYLFVGIYVVVCLALMLVVLLQQGKGGDMASAFGGGGSQAAFGARAGATVLSRATAILASIFILGALVLGVMRGGEDGSVVGGRAPAAPVTAPAAPVTAPATPATPDAAPATPATPASETPAPQP